MYTRSKITILALTAILVLGAAESQAARLAHRTRLEFGAGLWLEDNIRVVERRYGWVEQKAVSSRLQGSVGISHWIQENAAFTVTYNLLDVDHWSDIDYDGWEFGETSLAQSVLFGMRLYFPRTSRHQTMYSYLTGAIGPYIGTTHYYEEDPCDCERYTELETVSAFGGHIGGGIDFQIGPNFMLGMSGGYNFQEDFERPVNDRYNYNGPEMKVTLSFLLGRSRWYR